LVAWEREPLILSPLPRTDSPSDRDDLASRTEGDHRPECAPLSQDAVYTHVPALYFHDALCQGQPQPCSLRTTHPGWSDSRWSHHADGCSVERLTSPRHSLRSSAARCRFVLDRALLRAALVHVTRIASRQATRSGGGSRYATGQRKPIADRCAHTRLSAIVGIFTGRARPANLGAGADAVVDVAFEISATFRVLGASGVTHRNARRTSARRGVTRIAARPAPPNDQSRVGTGLPIHRTAHVLRVAVTDGGAR
jgi:hypothetical protein